LRAVGVCFIVWWNEERKYLGSMPQALNAIWDRETTWVLQKGFFLQKCDNAHAQAPNRSEGTCINDMNTEKHAWINKGYPWHEYWKHTTNDNEDSMIIRMSKKDSNKKDQPTSEEDPNASVDKVNQGF